MPRTLIAGFGNVLRGDDGFGVFVLRQLEGAPWARDVDLLEVGTGGIRLAQELLARYDCLIIVDAMTRGGAPGSVYVQEVEAVTEVDLHLAVPSRAVFLAKALGALPPKVYLVGCEPVEVDELRMELSAPVRAAVDAALQHIRDLVASALRPRAAGKR